MSPDDPTRLPSAHEIDPWDTLDGRYAVRHFHGKSIAEAAAQFGHPTSLTYTEDLIWMGPVGFRFYVQSAVQYGRSERSDEDSDFINGLEGALRYWLSHSPRELAPCAQLLAQFCYYVVRNFSRYDADPEIYVGLYESYEELAQRFARLANDQPHGV